MSKFHEGPPQPHFDEDGEGESTLPVEMKVSAFCETQCKLGKYVLPELVIAKVKNFIQEMGPGEIIAKFTINHYLWNIFAYGDNAIAHLCFPLRYHVRLIINGIDTMAELHQALTEGRLRTMEPLMANNEQYIAQTPQ